MANTTSELISVDALLGKKLDIPDYQRPYKWDIQNINDLFLDITNAISDADKYKNFKYRIGTIILHKNKDKKDVCDIVDGQQRIISLVLIKHYLEEGFECSILKNGFTNKETQYNIHNNYKHIKEWFSLKSEEDKNRFKSAFANILEVVVICVDKVEEAFQLFDSQNTRGKALDPHDLLKAYHLREMKGYPYEMEHAVTKWEAKDTKKIKELFDLYLFPIWNWSRGIKSKNFTDKEIGTFKGISESSPYFYAKRANRAAPYFQITEPFISGSDFFEMVDHYMNLLRDIKTEICTNPEFIEIKRILCTEGKVINPKAVEDIKTAEDLDDIKRKSKSFSNTRDLFYCALLFYYDKFHNFDEIAVKKLFLWAFMLCVDLYQVNDQSVDKYAVGDKTSTKYTNAIGMFSKISLARMHYDISGLRIKVTREPDKPSNDKWEYLYNAIKTIGGAK